MVSTFVLTDARQRGFEPLTHGLEGRCSVHLSYWRGRLILVGASRFERPTTCAQGRCASRLRYAPSKVSRLPNMDSRPHATLRDSGRGEPGAECPHGTRPVTHPLLVGGRGGGEGGAELVGHEHRIVAEPTAAARGGRDPAAAGAPRSDPPPPPPPEG